MTLIGIDVGGTKIKAGILTSQLKVLDSCTTPTQSAKGKKQVLSNIYSVIDQYISSSVKGIGIGIPGTVKDGKIHQAPNLKAMKGFDIRKALLKKYKVQVAVENDVTCFTISQHKKHKVSHLVTLTLGTGVGGGIIANNQLYKGGTCTAGELGHMVVKDDGIRCVCGNKGCLEMYISGKAITRRYKELTGLTKKPYEIAGENSRTARLTIKETGYYLGVGLANIVNGLNPEVIVVGGSIALIDGIFPTAKKEMKKRALALPVTHVRIVQNKSLHSSIMGAASLLS